MKHTAKELHVANNLHKKHKLFTHENAFKAVMKFSWPLIIAFFAYSSYIFIDRAICTNFVHYPLNHIPAQYHGDSASVVRVAIQLVYPFYTIFLGAAILFSAGLNSLYLQLKIKNNDVNKTRTNYLADIFYGVLLISVLVSCILYAIAVVYVKFIAIDSPFVGNQALLFLLPFALCNPFWTISNIFASIARCEGHSVFAGLLTLFVFVCNVFFDVLFIIVLHLSLWAAAWSCFIGYVIQFTITSAFLWKFFPHLIKGIFQKPSFNLNLLYKTGTLGIYPLVTRVFRLFVVISIPFLGILVPYNYTSTTISSPFAFWSSFASIVLSIFFYFTFFIDASRISVKVMCSYNRNLKNFHRIKQLLNAAFWWSFGYAILITVLIISLTSQIFYFFNDYNQVQINLGYQFLWLSFITYFCFAIQSYISTFYQTFLKAMKASFVASLPWISILICLLISIGFSHLFNSIIPFFSAFGIGMLIANFTCMLFAKKDLTTDLGTFSLKKT